MHARTRVAHPVRCVAAAKVRETPARGRQKVVGELKLHAPVRLSVHGYLQPSSRTRPAQDGRRGPVERRQPSEPGERVGPELPKGTIPSVALATSHRAHGCASGHSWVGGVVPRDWYEGQLGAGISVRRGMRCAIDLFMRIILNYAKPGLVSPVGATLVISGVPGRRLGATDSPFPVLSSAAQDPSILWKSPSSVASWMVLGRGSDSHPVVSLY